MRISDWSSDVCSSDLHVAGVYARTDIQRGVHKAPANEALRGLYLREIGNERKLSQMINRQRHDIFNPANINIIRDFRSDGRGDRKSGVKGKSVSGRVDLGGRRSSKKKNKKNKEGEKQDKRDGKE